MMKRNACSYCLYSFDRRFVRSGFTMIELLVVVVIMGILSASVIPAMNNVQSMREGAARDDVVRLLEVVKGRAVASGVPHGLRVDIASGLLTIVEIDDQGDVVVEIDPLTNGNRMINIGVVYPGVSIGSLINGDGSNGAGTVWFDFESTPMTRSGVGGAFSHNSEAVDLTLSSGGRVLVHPYSGTVEVR